MNLFRNTYNDIDEIREWIISNPEVCRIFCDQHPDEDIGVADLETIKDWFDEHEDIASAYREYHYGKQWASASGN